MATKNVPPIKVILGINRVSYVHLTEPTSFEGSEPKYDVTFLIHKDSPDVAKIAKVIEDMYNLAKTETLGGLPFTSPNLWYPLRDGDEYLLEKPEAVEYADHYFLKANSSSQPAAFDSAKNEIFDLSTIYSGCYCRADIACFAFNKNGKKGFGFFLNSVMFMEDGERLGGGGQASPDAYDDEPIPAPARGVARPAAAATPRPSAQAPVASRPGQPRPGAPAPRHAAPAEFEEDGSEFF